MKDLHMFNRLFFALCSAFVLCTSVAAIADSEQKWYTINTPVTTVNAKPAADCMYECIKKGELRGAQKNITTKQIRVYGTQKQIDAAIDAIKDENLTSPSIKQASARIKYHEQRKAQYFKNPETIRISNQYIKKYKIMLQAARTARKEKVMQTLDTTSTKRSVAHEKAKKLKEEAAAKKKIADAKAKLIEDARLAKIAADKVIEDERLAKIAADKVIEVARLAKIAQDKANKIKEEKRLAKIAAEKEEKRLAKIAADREKERKRLAEELKKQQAYAYKVKMEGESLEKRLKDPVFAKKYKEDQIKLGWMLERVQRKEEAARIKEVIRKQRLEAMVGIVLKVAGRNGTNNPNIIKSITKDGIVRTTYCNPGPCTPGSVKMHGILSGIEMGIDIGTLAKRIKANAAQTKSQDNTNENNAKTAEETASLGVVSLDTLFAEAEADLDETNDLKWTRARSIPIEQVIRAREAHTDYIRNSHENEMYCLYEGC